MQTQNPVVTETVSHTRRIANIVHGREVMDGAGVRIQRLLTQELQQRLDPFLMLDAFRSDDPQDYIAGFPDHPHRGFETITYMIQGRMRHRDSAGHEGLLENGSVQWMTAGRGVIHSEMPEQENGRMEGFQLWLNLPARDKLVAPAYRDIAANQIPAFTTVEHVLVRVVAGESHGVPGAVQRPHTAPLYLDVQLPVAASFQQPLPAAHNAFLHVYRGEISVAGVTVQAGQMAILDNEAVADGVSLTAQSDSCLLLIAGQPLREPIVQHGPFVMNSTEEIRQAFADYRAGKFA